MLAQNLVAVARALIFRMHHLILLTVKLSSPALGGPADLVLGGKALSATRFGTCVGHALTENAARLVELFLIG